MGQAQKYELKVDLKGADRRELSLSVKGLALGLALSSEVENVLLRGCGNVEIGAAAEELPNSFIIWSYRSAVLWLDFVLFREAFKPLAHGELTHLDR